MADFLGLQVVGDRIRTEAVTLQTVSITYSIVSAGIRKIMP